MPEVKLSLRERAIKTRNDSFGGAPDTNARSANSRSPVRSLGIKKGSIGSNGLRIDDSPVLT